ncbi:unnamed protein product [Gulo gulo]|uniref:Uncharacterized protein n=1 Tax=Gulo gulo TaxID=48420 RepID=A0A9X9PWA9_GULGU|nr:unnamed protein product [Gulo gulo]
MTWLLEWTKCGPTSGPLSCCPAGGIRGCLVLLRSSSGVPLTCHLSEHALAPSPRRTGLEPMVERPRLRVLTCKEHIPSQGAYGGGGGSQLAHGVSGLSWDMMWVGTVDLAPASLCQAWRGAPGAGSVPGTMVVGAGAPGPGAEHLDVGTPTGPRALLDLEVILWNPPPLAPTPALRPRSGLVEGQPGRPRASGPQMQGPRLGPEEGARPAGGAAGPAPAAALPGPRGRVGGRPGDCPGGPGPQGRTRCGGDPQPPALTGLSCSRNQLCRKGSPRKQAGHSLSGPTGSPRPHDLGRTWSQCKTALGSLFPA